MSGAVKTIRPYRSERRRQQAKATRDEILGAARVLFAAPGYGATSMADVADRAGVAVQTVYAVFGSKRGIVIALLDLIDEIGGVADNTARMRLASGPDELLALAVHLTRELNERAGDVIGMIRAAAAVEPDLAEAVTRGLERHRRGVQRVVGALAGLGAIRTGLGETEAVALMGTLTSPESFATLTGDFGQSFDDAEALILDTLRRYLLEGGAA